MTNTPMLTIKATNIDLTPAIAAAVDKSFGSLTKFVRPKEDQEVRLLVEVGRRNKGKSKADDLFFAELNIVVGGERHRVVAQARELYDAIDEAKKEMTSLLSKAHGRKREDERRGGRMAKEVLRAATAAPTLPKLNGARVAGKKAEKTKVEKASAAAAPSKKVVAKKVSPRSHAHGTKNTRGAKNRPTVRVAPGRSSGGKR